MYETKLKDIIEQPQTFEKIHESIFRSYHALQYLIEMVERGDSKETIIEIINFIRNYPDDNN